MSSIEVRPKEGTHERIVWEFKQWFIRLSLAEVLETLIPEQLEEFGSMLVALKKDGVTTDDLRTGLTLLHAMGMTKDQFAFPVKKPEHNGAIGIHYLSFQWLEEAVKSIH